MITVGTATAEPGTRAQGRLDVGELAMGSRLSIPVLVLNGVGDGPTLWLNGAVHGDEINGFLVCRELGEELDLNELAGAVVMTPLSNPLAVQWRQKVNPYDYLDLDQQFPGDANGLYSQRTAHVLFSAIQQTAQALISFHTVATPFEAQPYTVYKSAPGVSPPVADKVEELALAFGARANCRVDLANAAGELPGGVAGALDVNCSLAGIPAFMAEVGSGGVFQPEHVAMAKEGVRRVMGCLGMVEAPPEADQRQVIITRRRFVYTDTAGMFRASVCSGDVLAPGARLGVVQDLFTDLAEIALDEAAYVIMTRRHPVVHTGDRAAFVGLEWRDVS